MEGREKLAPGTPALTAAASTAARGGTTHMPPDRGRMNSTCCVHAVESCSLRKEGDADMLHGWT